MFGYKRSYPYRWSRYSSYGRASKYSRGGTIGRAIAGSAAAKRSDKTETYSCTVNGVMNVGLQSGQNLSTVTTLAPYAGGIRSSGTVDDDRNLCHGGAINDRGFRMKCSCFDECKLDTMKVTITPAQLFSHAAVTMTMCTFWDRKASPKECGFVGGGDWMANGAVPTALEIFNNEGTIKSAITNNTIYGFKRYCRASSILEKGGYHDSTILYNPTEDQSPTSWMYLDAWMRGPLGFSPALYFMMYSPATFSSNQILSFSYKVEYTFTFRNPKSDLDTFLLLESPGYVNPDSRNREGDNSRKVGDSTLIDDIGKMYSVGSIKSMNLSDATRCVDDLFVKSSPPSAASAAADEDEEMKVEKF